MLTFIKLDNTHILYGGLLLEKQPDRGIEILGISDYSKFIDDPDDSIWYGLCAIAVNLPRQKTDE